MTAVVLGWLALGACGTAAILALVADMIAGERASIAPTALLLGVASAAAGGSAVLGLAGPGPPDLIAAPGMSAVVFALAVASVVLIGGARGRAPAQAAALIALCAGATAVLAGARDMVTFLIAAETAAVVSYALVASARTRASEEAAMKYFVQGSVAAGTLVLAVAVLAGRSGGITGYGELAGLPAGEWGGAIPLAMMLLVAVIAFKLSAAPFHSWAPDAYETAPPEISAFIATAPKAAVAVAAVALLREGLFAPAFGTAGFAMAALALTTIVVGNLAGLRQTSYTRMLGYSGVAHGGYLLVALAIPLGGVAPVAIMGAAYAVASAGAFAAASVVRARRPDWDGSIAGLAGLGREMPFVSAAVAACMFSLTGIPLTAGFWGKLVPFLNAFRAGAGWLVAAALVGSVVSFGYYGRVLRAMYLDDVESRATEGAVPDAAPEEHLPAGPRAAMVAIGAAVVIVGVAPLLSGLGFLAGFLS